MVQNKKYYLQKLLGMSVYSVEDALYQVYGVEWRAESGRCSLVSGRHFYISGPDDCLAMVLAVLSQRCQQRYPACAGLSCYSASGYGWSLDLDAIYGVFNRESFEANTGAYNHYKNTLDAVKNLPPPSQCPVMQRPLWGKFYTALAHIFKIFKDMNRESRTDNIGL